MTEAGVPVEPRSVSSTPADISLDDILRLPADTLAYRILPEIPARPFRRESWIASFLTSRGASRRRHLLETKDQERIGANPEAAANIASALQRLLVDGLLVDWPPSDPSYTTEGQGDVFQLTKLGRDLQAVGPSAQGTIQARRRLGVELHPALKHELDPLIAVGALEQATFRALRAVEERVFDLAGSPRSARGSRIVGSALMQMAFGDGGPLVDPDADPGERVGVTQLFAGAFGAVRNPLAHTTVEWDDPTEAAEFVLFADLLMRQLDRVEARLATDSG